MPVWVLIPKGKVLSSEAQNELGSSHAEIYHFQIDDAFLQFPFTLKTLASAQAERMAEEQQSILAWMILPASSVTLPWLSTCQNRSLRFSPHGYRQYWCPLW